MLYRIWHKLTKTSRAAYLLASLTALIFAYPVISDRPVAGFILVILFATTPVTGVYAISDRKRTTVIATALAIPAILSIFGHFFFKSGLISDGIFLGLITIYYAFTTAAIIGHIFRKRKVDADTIISAVSAYLMIGLTFAVAFMLVQYRSGGAFSESTGDHIIGWHDMFYYSIVTLTTLGYGDISPTIPISRSLATFEAVCGVMYMSILIAKLVSDYQSSRGTNG
jgi:hypothetical protein